MVLNYIEEKISLTDTIYLIRKQNTPYYKIALKQCKTHCSKAIFNNLLQLYRA